MLTGGTCDLTKRRFWLITAGLVYLGIPNLLFLIGWFTPWAATLAGGLIVAYTARAIWLMKREAVPTTGDATENRLGFHMTLLAVALSVAFLFITRGSIGIWPTHWDYSSFRQACIGNLRDAAWPVILPDGKEMSYFIANLLPEACLGRILPEGLHQWCIVVWSIIPIILSLMLLGTFTWGGATPWGKRIAILALVLFVFVDPLRILFPSDASAMLHKGICYFSEVTGIHLESMVAYRGVTTYTNPLSECTTAYNAVPPLLLAISMCLASGKAGRCVIPLTMSLLAALTPPGCLGLAPLALVLYYTGRDKNRGIIRQSLPEAAVPAVMMVLLAVYFTRAEGNAHVAPVWVAWGWWEELLFGCGILAAWALLVLPLWARNKSNPVFLTMAGYLLVGHLLFIGSFPGDGFLGMNEFWIKSSPAYIVLLALFWVKDWSLVPRWKYLLLAGALLYTVPKNFSIISRAGERAYLDVEDDWNGHLCHDAPFLDQNVPPCKEPKIPGIMLRQAGESEWHFPGCLLPHAPGCDYSLPANKK